MIALEYMNITWIMKLLTLIVYIPLRAFIAAIATSLFANLTNPHPSRYIKHVRLKKRKTRAT